MTMYGSIFSGNGPQSTQESDACDYDQRINYLLLLNKCFSCTEMFTQVEITADPAVLREVVKGGNLEKEDKAKITKAIKS